MLWKIWSRYVASQERGPKETAISPHPLPPTGMSESGAGMLPTGVYLTPGKCGLLSAQSKEKPKPPETGSFGGSPINCVRENSRIDGVERLWEPSLHCHYTEVVQTKSPSASDRNKPLGTQGHPRKGAAPLGAEPSTSKKTSQWVLPG